MSFNGSQEKDMNLCHFKGVKDKYIHWGRKGEAIIFSNHLKSVMSAALRPK